MRRFNWLILFFLTVGISMTANAGPKERLVSATLELEESLLKAKTAQIHALRQDAVRSSFGLLSVLTEVRKDEFGIAPALMEFMGAALDYDSNDREYIRVMLSMNSQIGTGFPVMNAGELCQQLDPPASSKKLQAVISVCNLDRLIGDLEDLYHLLIR